MGRHDVEVVIKARDEASKTFGTLEKSFNRTMLRLGGMYGVEKGLELGTNLMTVAVKNYEYQQALATGTVVETLDAQIALNDAWKNAIGDLPIIGRALRRLFDAFDGSEKLKKTREEFERFNTVLQQLKKTNEEAHKALSIRLAKAFGASPLQIKKMEIEQEQQEWQKDIASAKKTLSEAQAEYKKQVEQENREIEQRLQASKAKAMSKFDLPSTLWFKEWPISQRSEKFKKEMLEPLKKEVGGKIFEYFRAKVAGWKELFNLKWKEWGEKSKEPMERKQKAYDFAAEQERKLHELKLQFIKDEKERRIAEINLRYDEEVKAARKLGYSTDILEEQRRTALELAGKAKDKGRPSPKLAPFESRFMVGFGHGRYGAQADSTEQNTTQMVKILRNIDRGIKILTDMTGRNRPTFPTTQIIPVRLR